MQISPGAGNSTVSNLSAVLNTKAVVLIAQCGGSSTMQSQCTLTIPTGVTATVNYSVSQYGSGSVYVLIGSTMFMSGGTITLYPGTYYLKAYACATLNPVPPPPTADSGWKTPNIPTPIPTSTGGSLASMSVQINYP
jgi:hypothetical protein